MQKAVINLTTKEYFIYNNNEEKTKILNKLMDYSPDTKILTNLLKFIIKKITIDSCGETYWYSKDHIEDNIDIDKIDNKFDKVPNIYLE